MGVILFRFELIYMPKRRFEAICQQIIRRTNNQNILFTEVNFNFFFSYEIYMKWLISLYGMLRKIKSRVNLNISYNSCWLIIGHTRYKCSLQQIILIYTLLYNESIFKKFTLNKWNLLFSIDESIVSSTKITWRRNETEN